MGSVVVRFRTSGGMQEVAVSLRGEATVRDLLTRLAGEAGGELEAVNKKALDDSYTGLIVVLNGTIVRSLNGTNTPIGDGDTVSIMPVVVGG